MGIRLVEAERRDDMTLHDHQQVVDALEPLRAEYSAFEHCAELYAQAVMEGVTYDMNARLSNVFDHLARLPVDIENVNAAVVMLAARE